MLFSYTMFIYTLAALSGDEIVFAGGLLGIALGLVPAVFVVGAFVSQNPETVLSTIKATGAWVAVMLPIGFVDVPIALVAAFGAGGIIVLRMREAHTWQSRAIAVGACVVWTFLLRRIAPELGLFAGAPLPFLAITTADLLRERKVESAD